MILVIAVHTKKALKSFNHKPTSSVHYLSVTFSSSANNKLTICARNRTLNLINMYHELLLCILYYQCALRKIIFHKYVLMYAIFFKLTQYTTPNTKIIQRKIRPLHMFLLITSNSVKNLIKTKWHKQYPTVLQEFKTNEFFLNLNLKQRLKFEFPYYSSLQFSLHL